MEVKFDAASLNAQLFQLANELQLRAKNAEAQATRIIRVVSRQVQREAVKRAPILEGHLQRSIDMKVEGGPMVHEVTGWVFISTNSPASEYAIYMHEGVYDLGPESARKQAGQSEVVGRKFLERAYNENKTAIMIYIEQEIRKALKL